MFATAASIVLLIIGLTHSILGERELLGPLFSKPWEIELPRFAVERILRFAWHLTSIAWIALALIGLGWEPLLAFGACCMCSGAVIFVMLRGHLAWPLFLAAGLLALLEQGALGTQAMSGLAALGSAVSLMAALLHVYWVARPNAPSMKMALPHKPDGQVVMLPSRALTALVALQLGGISALQASAVWGVVWPAQTWCAGAIALLLGVRVIGDGNYVGLSKKFRDSDFGRRDDALYTPLVVVLCVGCSSALYLMLGS